MLGFARAQPNLPDFMVIKAINKLKRLEQTAPPALAAPAAPPEEVKLLREIRDALKRP